MIRRLDVIVINIIHTRHANIVVRLVKMNDTKHEYLRKSDSSFIYDHYNFSKELSHCYNVTISIHS